MDPTQCYLEMIAAMDAGDFATARDRALALQEWLDRGGFAPPNYDPAEVRFNLEGVLKVQDGAGARMADVYRARQRYYQALDLRVWWFLSGQVGGSEVREVRGAETEVSEIIDRLGQAVVDPVLKEVHDFFRERIGDRSWQAYLHGSDEERQQVQEEFLTGTGDWRLVTHHATQDAFGPVIDAYTRRQALADGVLKDAGTLAADAGFRVPVALTAAVWEAYVRVPETASWQDETGRFWDILTMLRHEIRCDAGGNETQFGVFVQNAEAAPKLVTLKVVSGPGDDGEHVLTIMLPDED